MKPDPSARIPEERVAAILARAAELDRATRETIGYDAVRAAALEAGISSTAVDRALAEYSDGTMGRLRELPAAEETESKPPRWRRWLGKLKRPVAHGFVAFFAGLFAAQMDEAGVMLGLLMVWAYAARHILRYRRTRRALPFALSMVLVTVCGMLGLGAGEGDEDVLIGLLMAGSALMVAGSAVVKVRLPRRWLLRLSQSGVGSA